MNTCEFETRLNAYHDNELSPADRAMVEQHLNSCADCRVALAEMAEVSAVFASNVPAGLSQIGQHRLHKNVDRQLERGLVRLSWALSGIAAAIVVVGSIWLQQAGGNVMYLPSESVAMVPDANSDAATPAEQYYLADATVRTVEEY